MISISITFTRAASAKTGIEPVFDSFTFWMLVWAITIDDDAQRREKERRRKRQAAAQPQRKPAPPTPKPF